MKKAMIDYAESSRTFHLHNGMFSYIMKVMDNGILAQLYYGSPLKVKENYDYLFEQTPRPMSVTWSAQQDDLSLEHIRQEYPQALSGDMRQGAISILQNTGSRISEFLFESFEIMEGKPALEGLPACYAEDQEEAQTLCIHLYDQVIQARITLFYTIYKDRAVLCRSARIENVSNESFVVDSLMSAILDLPDDEFEMLDLAGAWARERHIDVHRLHPGVQSIYSLRGHSSHNFNPFMCLKKPWTTEDAGQAYGFSLVYSGNFQISADVDTYNTTRVSIGMHPLTFSWPLHPGQSFQSPEAVFVYSDQGLNAMSQTFHSLFQQRLARGVWKNKVRPILLNSWEGIYFDVTEQKILDMAKGAKDLGIELFVLDDGWFKNRNDETSSLGDWVEDFKKLPGGLKGLSTKIKDMGLDFGLWIEPEMISENSDLYRAHPEWVLSVPNRRKSAGRRQYVLDFSNPKAVNCIYEQLIKVFDGLPLSYIKWDMNRSLSEVYSIAWTPKEQGTVYHRFILGVYSLYERLIERYPNILFESCASGGARFDPGMLYYAPQAWTSDDTDAVERLKIQYGTSMLYPISSMGSHVSQAPNHQLNRYTPLKTRANVAYFGTFGYELDPNTLDEAQKEEIRRQIAFMKEYREVIQFGTFYRLRSPFDGNETAWMVVGHDKNTALVGYYRTLQKVNSRYRRIFLRGLDLEKEYSITDRDYACFGSELESAGLVVSDSSAGENRGNGGEGDYLSRLFVLKAITNASQC